MKPSVHTNLAKRAADPDWRVPAILMLALVCAAPALPQTTTARFYGVVQDGTGAVVPGAAVTMTHEGTASITAKTADSDGEFTFDFLRVGVYTLKIQAQGFKTSASGGIELAAGQNVRQNFTLELGSVSETVSVEGASFLVDTITAEQRQSFDTHTVTELPVARRNFSEILNIGTGVSSSTSGGHRGVRMNGLGKNGATFAVDATDASGTNEGRHSAMHQGFNYIDIMTIEAVQEVQTIKGVVAAEYGQALSGTINLITKSGTNQYHGSLFENFQAENLNARNPFLAGKVPLTFNQFGGSFGGPIRRDRIFIFGAYEGYRERAFLAVQGNVPTAKLRQEMLAAVPEYRRTLDTMPLPSDPHSPEADTGFFRGARSQISRENHAVVKSDFRLSSAGNLALTYTRGRPYQILPSLHIGNGRNHQGWVERGTVNFITGGASWTSESRFGYNLTNVNRVHQFYLDGVDTSQPEKTLGGRRIAYIVGPGFTTAQTEVLDLGGPTWTIDQKYALHRGPHSFKFGGKYSSRGGGRFNIENPVVTYNTKTALLANVPDRVSVIFGVNPYVYDAYEFGFFAQDDWRVSPRLVINLGVRYDFFSRYAARPSTDAPAGLYNLDTIRDDQFNFGPVRDTKNPIENDPGINIGPRLGFSYNPDGAGKTVVRGGFSVMFSPLVWTAFNIAVSSAPNIPRQTFFSRPEGINLGLRYPIYNDNIRPLVSASDRFLPSDLFNPHIQGPYTMNLYLGIQRALSSTAALESAFVGNRGVKLFMVRVYNPVERETGRRRNPNLGEGRYYDDSQNSVYYSWQTSLRKRYSRNFSGSAHYTWGKALSYTGGDIGGTNYGDQIETVQNFFNWRAERGPSAGDVSHYVAAETVYELPRLEAMNGALRQLVGGWQVSGIFRAGTGEPLRITQPSGIVGSRPDYVGGDPTLDGFRDSLQFLNPRAFARVPTNTTSGATIRPGNVGNGAVRGPGQWGLDLAVGKAFAIRESVRFQIRADMFNFLNHRNLTNVESRIDRVNFGRFVSAGAPRVIQLNARFSW